MKTLTLALTVFLLSTTTLKTSTKRSLVPRLDWSKAFAARVLDGSADFSSATSQADFIRYNYYLINGSTSEYELSQGTLTYLPYLNLFLDGFGEAVGALGYGSCADVPTSGSGSVRGLDLTFSAGDRTVPSHFADDAGETFEKKVIVRQGGEGVIEMQLTCSGTLTSGYVLMPRTAFSGDQMGFEAFFQKNTATNSTFVDFFMEINNGYMDVRTVMRFMAPSEDSYKIYALNTYGMTGNGSAVAIQGVPNGLTNANLIYTQNVSSGDAATAVVWGDLSGVTDSGSQKALETCLDLGSNTAASGCVAIDDPGALSVNGTSYSYTLNSIRNLTLSSIP
ncbi:MAG: hypothetical protein ACLGG7_07780 [Bacteriovoracia bacterium]